MDALETEARRLAAQPAAVSQQNFARRVETTFGADLDEEQLSRALAGNARLVTLLRLEMVPWARVGSVDSWERQLATIPSQLQ